MKKITVKTRHYTFAELMDRLVSGNWCVIEDSPDHFVFMPTQCRRSP